jgi:hypothetical protein
LIKHSKYISNSYQKVGTRCELANVGRVRLVFGFASFGTASSKHFADCEILLETVENLGLVGKHPDLGLDAILGKCLLTFATCAMQRRPILA